MQGRRDANNNFDHHVVASSDTRYRGRCGGPSLATPDSLEYAVEIAGRHRRRAREAEHDVSAMGSVRWLALLAGAVPTLCAADASATADPASMYRVTGVIAVGADDWMVLVEAAGGTYLRVRVGDELSGGQVLEIAPHWMRLVFPDGEQVWRLSPGERPLPKPAAPGEANASDTETQPLPGAHEPIIRSVDPAALAELERESDRLRGTPGSLGDPGFALPLLLEPILELGLPDDARVVRLNDQPIESVGAGIEQINETLRRNNAVWLTVERAIGGAHQRVYFMPEPPAKE